ncbi:MAG: ligase-associated DNA damage response endonuclease PdeM [Cyclobacteriaceae bacterium]
MTLLPEKCLYWHTREALILSDLHLGKAGHFRKAGIPVPGHIHFHDLQRLDQAIRQQDVRQVIFIGDLFHSDINSEWLLFEEWMTTHPEVKFVLVKGNHDILPAELYRNSKMEIHDDCLDISPFLLCHIPPEPDTLPADRYTISGHIHPGIRLRGMGRQSETLACFHFGAASAVLPAFGKFTGLYRIKPAPTDKIFAVAGTRVISL